MNPRLKDISKVTGYSVTAVSQALRGSGKLSADTIRTIRQVAEKLGYTPNLFASGLRENASKPAGSSLAVGLFIQQGPKRSYPVQEFVSALKHEADRVGAFINTAPEPEDDRTLQTTLRRWKNAGVQAVIMSGQGTLVHQRPPALMELPIVVVERTSEVPLPTVSHETFTSVERLGNLAFQRGYRRIGFCLNRHDFPNLDDREREGAFYTLREHLGTGHFTPPFLGQHGDYSAIRSWLAQEKPDAVIGFHEGNYFDLINHGIRIPEDLGFASLHKSEFEANAFISGYRDDYHLYALAALRLADSLLRMRYSSQPTVEGCYIVPRIFIEGTTLPQKS